MGTVDLLTPVESQVLSYSVTQKVHPQDHIFFPPNSLKNFYLLTYCPKTNPQIPTITMKWMILTVVSLAFFAAAHAEDLVEEEGDARLGYITVGSSGATTLTFNATSIQNAIILGLFILVLGALVLPLFGVSMGEEAEETGYGYGYEQPAYAYDESATNYGYAKRSVDSVGPVLAAMAAAEDRYN